ncbi:MAG: tetratricopeptide repeat protein [Spirochaeta sp.]
MKRSLAMCALLVLIVIQPVFGQTGDRFLYQSAEQRFRSADYAIALERYEQFLREHPSSELVPDVQFRRAVTLYQLERFEDAADLLMRVQSRYRSTRYLSYVPFYLGVSQFQLGEYTRSIENLSEVQVSNTAVQNEAMLYLARGYIATGEDDRAVEILRSLIDSDSIGEDVRGFAGALYVSLLHDQDRYQDILDVTGTLEVESLPSQWGHQVQLFEAEALFFLGDFEAAREGYEQLTESRLEISTVAFQRLFLIAQETGTTEEVAGIIRSAEQVLAGRSEVLKDFWLRVGLSSFQNEEYRLADLYLRRVWDLRGVHDVDEIVPLYLAEIAESRDDVQQGISVLQDYLERESSPTVLFRLAALQAKQQQWNESRANISQFRSLYSDSELYPQASYLHAYVLVQLDLHNEALQVIQGLRSQGLVSGLQGDLLRLEAQVQREIGDLSSAAESFRDYLALQPDDLSAVVEYTTILFEQERFTAVNREIENTLEQFPDLQGDSPEIHAKLHYLRGLAAVTNNDFPSAVQYFSPLSELSAQEAADLGADVAAVHPYNLFYHAWSYYQNGDFSRSFDLFNRVADDYEDTSIAARAAYLAGWSAYANSDYAAAETLLMRVQTFDTEDDLTANAGYLLAQTLVERNDLSAALNVYRNVFLDHPDSRRAAEARYGYAETLLQMDREDDALDAFREVTQRYPDTFLGQESQFRRAEIHYDRENYRDVQELLFEYRTNYPDGERIDDALYLGGEIALRLEEPSGALLLWNRLIRNHRQSPNRFDAMVQAAQIHRDRGEYRSALNLVSEAMSRYPDRSGSAGLERVSNELVLLVSGVSEREAELRVEIERNDGVSTDAGRTAIIELGRTILLESFQLDGNADRVIPLLEDLTERTSENPDQAAEAYLLIGEYYMRTGGPGRAADSFIQAASTVRDDRDLLARSLFRGAEALIRDDRSGEARQLIDRIQNSFPQSQWSEAAEGLLED